jgi:hypothetical protein
MSSLPPDASETPPPDPAEGESAGAPETPRWAVPAVPPPWATPAPAAVPVPTPTPAPTPAASPLPVAPAAPVAPVAPAAAEGSPAPTAPPFGQPGWTAPAPIARSSPFNRQKWLPTIAVAGIIAAVVLGGLGLDQAIAAPSIGTVNVGGPVTVVGSPGWARADDGSSAGVVLQKGNTRITIVALSYDGTASAALDEVETSIKSSTSQISFGDEQDGQLGGRNVAMAGFEAIVTGGTVDGEVICMIAAGNAVVFQVVSPQGELDQVVDDVKAMVSSVEVVQ